VLLGLYLCLGQTKKFSHENLGIAMSKFPTP
jgi:hypothetical protein